MKAQQTAPADRAEARPLSVIVRFKKHESRNSKGFVARIDAEDGR